MKRSGAAIMPCGGQHARFIRQHTRRMGRSTLGLIVVASTLFASAASVEAASRAEPPRDEPASFLFLNGRYVPPPYTAELIDGDEAILLNETRITESTFDLAAYTDSGSRRRGFGGEPRRFGRRPRDFGDDVRPAAWKPSPLKELQRDLQTYLMATSDTVAILSEGRPPLFVDLSEEGELLLRTLVERSEAASPPDVEQPVRAPKALPREVDREAWQELVSGFQASPEFVAGAKAALAKLAAAEAAAKSAATKNFLSDQIAFPMTLLAMISVVLGFGHLMSNRPLVESPAGEASSGARATSVVVRSVALITVFSMVDLVWTLTASGSGQMRELNPLGSHLIADPLRLTAFKTTVVAISVGIFFALRQRPAAQIASWWSCLLLTLLTSRWVMFHSMFM